MYHSPFRFTLALAALAAATDAIAGNNGASKQQIMKSAEIGCGGRCRWRCFKKVEVGTVQAILSLCPFRTQPIQADTFPSPHRNGTPQVTTWKAPRDFRSVKQELDYSCGAASLATSVNEFYGQSVTEKDILAQMGETDRASFQQLADVAPAFGVKALCIWPTRLGATASSPPTSSAKCGRAPIPTAPRAGVFC